MIKKTKQETCPYCGAKPEIVDSYYDSLDVTKDDTLVVIMNCNCLNCAKRWQEFYLCNYDGYAIYNAEEEEE